MLGIKVPPDEYEAFLPTIYDSISHRLPARARTVFPGWLNGRILRSRELTVAGEPSIFYRDIGGRKPP